MILPQPAFGLAITLRLWQNIRLSEKPAVLRCAEQQCSLLLWVDCQLRFQQIQQIGPVIRPVTCLKLGVRLHDGIPQHGGEKSCSIREMPIICRHGEIAHRERCAE